MTSAAHSIQVMYTWTAGFAVFEFCRFESRSFLQDFAPAAVLRLAVPQNPDSKSKFSLA
jgi:hypothetical protein